MDGDSIGTGNYPGGRGRNALTLHAGVGLLGARWSF
jgi:hypothetical protein